ncbi:hypothetical protein PBI_SPORTO_31 [Arthrobacter phage Sporto]|nr:hypothetical protein PBI_SPORTO_31 [Arthrobacter phage Sporto]
MGNHVAVIEGQNSGLVLSDRFYDVLRFFVEKGFPGLGVFYATVAAIWGWGYIAQVGGTFAALSILGAVFLTLARKGYVPPVVVKDPHYDGEVVADIINGQSAVRVELNESATQNLLNKQNLLIKGLTE